MPYFLLCIIHLGLIPEYPDPSFIFTFINLFHVPGSRLNRDESAMNFALNGFT